MAAALLNLLETPAAERIVYGFLKSSRDERLIPLYDVLYNSLVRVIAGPKAKEMIKGDLEQ